MSKKLGSEDREDEWATFVRALMSVHRAGTPLPDIQVCWTVCLGFQSCFLVCLSLDLHSSP